MSKQNNLDDFFKDKFNERTFEFKDSYWKDAERMIEDDNKRDWKNFHRGALDDYAQKIVG